MKNFSNAILLDGVDVSKAISILTDAGIECEAQASYSDFFFQIEADCAADRHIDSFTDEELKIWSKDYDVNIRKLSEIFNDNYDVIVDDEFMSDIALNFMKKQMRGE